MSLLLKTAFDWAAVWHKEQHRKYPGVQVPYMSHIAGVAAILSRHGFDDEVVAAGALHDVMEDCGIAHDDLVARFSERVAHLVRAASEEDRSLKWEERKRIYLERFSEKPWEAQAITLADKIDNLQSILVCKRDHGDPWQMLRRGRDVQMIRFRELAERARALAPHPLIDEYVKTLDDVDAQT